MSDYEVIQPRTDDADELIRMHAQSWIDAYPNEDEGISQKFIEEYVTKFSIDEGVRKRKEFIESSQTDPNQLFRIVKQKDGTVIGFVGASKSENSYEIGGLYVDKSQYGNGLADKLAVLALDWLGREHNVLLTVVAYNARAQNFYRKHGFEVVAGSERPYKDTPFEVIDMTRKADV